MKKFSKQRIFNKVKDHLLSQKQKSVNDDGDCVYRGENGLKCAIGALIKDKYYKPHIENRTPSKSIEVRHALSKSLGCSITNESAEFLDDLQEIHDFFDTSQWRGRLKDFAKLHNLKFAEALA